MRSTTALVICLTLFLAACAHTAPQMLADDQTAQHLLQDVPPHGYARLYLFDGRFVNGSTESFIAAHFRADELVDGVNIGSLNGGDVLIVDIPAGTHNLTWQERTSDAPMSKPLALNLQSGEQVYISNDYQMDSSSLVAFGAVGGAIASAANADSTSDGPYMTVRHSGAQMIDGYDVILPNQSAVNKLQAHH